MPNPGGIMIPVLLAQHVGVAIHPADERMSVLGIGIPIMLMVAAIVMGLTYMGVRLSRQHRELEHTERMRALEMGHPLPGSLPPAPFWTVSKIAGGMGLLLPAFALALAFTLSDGRTSPEIAANAWIAAGLIGVAGVIGATILTLRGEPAESRTAIARTMKPTMTDPDAYDTASQRSWSNGPADAVRTSHTA